MVQYTFYDILFYFLLYAFLGWLVEVSYYSIKDKHFINRGFISLPFQVPCGIAVVLLILTLPFLEKNYVVQFIAAAIIFAVVGSLTGVFSEWVSRLSHWKSAAAFTGTRKNWLELVVRAALGLLVYYIVHPVFMAGVSLIPGWLMTVIVWTGMGLLLFDFAAMLYTVRFRSEPATEEMARAQTQRFADRITRHIWNRLSRAYPGIEKRSGQGEGQKTILFAKGLCWDKIIWVFLSCALLGDIVETLYCGLVGGHWMNRSSVLYGPFSFVWGIGAVVLTVTLHQLASKSDWYIFAGGFLIGGTYEYMCSVFTELVFGTVFWDYSKMPLNIGGRTNVLFCFFWGLLAVLWVRVLYPRLNQSIEKIPPLTGKIVTWVIVFFMACNGLLTAAAMVRYNTRADRPEANGVVEAFLDWQYDDDYMEKRWPNMTVTDSAPQLSQN